MTVCTGPGSRPHHNNLNTTSCDVNLSNMSGEPLDTAGWGCHTPNSSLSQFEMRMFLAGWLCAARRQRWLPLLTQFLTRLEGFTASDQSQKAAVSGGREQPREERSCAPRDWDSFTSTSPPSAAHGEWRVETTRQTWGNCRGRKAVIRRGISQNDIY